MKNVRKLICATIVLVILILIYILVLSRFRVRSGGAGMYFERILKPDDSISRAVYDAVGEDLTYHGKEKINGEIRYDYELKKRDAGTISKFVKAVNSTLGDEQEKITVHVDLEFCAGCWTGIFSLYNYSDNNLEKADYDGFYSLHIYSPEHTIDQMFFEPSTYTGIEGIRQLKIGIQMQQRADEEGIDWYECWSELEEVTIIGADSEIQEVRIEGFVISSLTGFTIGKRKQNKI